MKKIYISILLIIFINSIIYGQFKNNFDIKIMEIEKYDFSESTSILYNITYNFISVKYIDHINSKNDSVLLIKSLSKHTKNEILNYINCSYFKKTKHVYSNEDIEDGFIINYNINYGKFKKNILIKNKFVKQLDSLNKIINSELLSSYQIKF